MAMFSNKRRVHGGVFARRVPVQDCGLQRLLYNACRRQLVVTDNHALTKLSSSLSIVSLHLFHVFPVNAFQGA